MKKVSFLSLLFFIPGVVFAGGFYMPSTTSSSTSMPKVEKTSPVVMPVSTTNSSEYSPVYETPIIQAVEPVDPSSVQLAPTADDLAPQYEPMNTEAPLWWSRTYEKFTAPVDRNTSSLDVYQTQQQTAQEKLLRYRTFMRNR